MANRNVESLTGAYRAYLTSSSQLRSQLEKRESQQEVDSILSLLSQHLLAAHTLVGVSLVHMGIMRYPSPKESEEAIKFAYKPDHMRTRLPSAWVRTNKSLPSSYPWQIQFFIGQDYNERQGDTSGELIFSAGGADYPNVYFTKKTIDLKAEPSSCVLGRDLNPRGAVFCGFKLPGGRVVAASMASTSGQFGTNALGLRISEGSSLRFFIPETSEQPDLARTMRDTTFIQQALGSIVEGLHREVSRGSLRRFLGW